MSGLEHALVYLHSFQSVRANISPKPDWWHEEWADEGLTAVMEGTLINIYYCRLKNIIFDAPAGLAFPVTRVYGTSFWDEMGLAMADEENRTDLSEAQETDQATLLSTLRDIPSVRRNTNVRRS